MLARQGTVFVLEGGVGFADLAALLLTETKFVSRRPQPFGHGLRHGRMHHPPFDVTPRLFTLFGRQFLGDGLELRLDQIATLGPVRPVLLGEGCVHVADLLPLFGCQSELLGCCLDSLRQRITERRNLRPISLGARFPRRFSQILDEPFHLIALLGRQHISDGFELRLKQLPALSPQGLEFVREGRVGLSDLRALLGRQSELVGHGL